LFNYPLYLTKKIINKKALRKTLQKIEYALNLKKMLFKNFLEGGKQWII